MGGASDHQPILLPGPWDEYRGTAPWNCLRIDRFHDLLRKKNMQETCFLKKTDHHTLSTYMIIHSIPISFQSKWLLYWYTFMYSNKSWYLLITINLNNLNSIHTSIHVSKPFASQISTPSPHRSPRPHAPRDAAPAAPCQPWFLGAFHGACGEEAADWERLKWALWNHPLVSKNMSRYF